MCCSTCVRRRTTQKSISFCREGAHASHTRGPGHCITDHDDRLCSVQFCPLLSPRGTWMVDVAAFSEAQPEPHPILVLPVLHSYGVPFCSTHSMCLSLSVCVCVGGWPAMQHPPLHGSSASFCSILPEEGPFPLIAFVRPARDAVEAVVAFLSRGLSPFSRTDGRRRQCLVEGCLDPRRRRRRRSTKHSRQGPPPTTPSPYYLLACLFHSYRQLRQG